MKFWYNLILFKTEFFSMKSFVFRNICAISITLRIKLIEKSRYDCLKRCGMRRFSVVRIYISIVQLLFFNLDDVDILLLYPKREFERCNYVDRARATFVSQVYSHFYYPSTQAILKSRDVYGENSARTWRERKFESCEGQESYMVTWERFWIWYALLTVIRHMKKNV